MMDWLRGLLERLRAVLAPEPMPEAHCPRCDTDVLSAGVAYGMQENGRHPVSGYSPPANDGLHLFRCHECGWWSWWDLDAAVPLLVRQ